MLHDIVPQSNRGNYIKVREDQIRYSVEKGSKKGQKIKIKFGAEVAEKAKIFVGERLKIQWDDVNKHILISRSDEGFTVQYPPKQKHYIILEIPKRVKIPMISKTFTNFHVCMDMIILDFSLEKF